MSWRKRRDDGRHVDPAVVAEMARGVELPPLPRRALVELPSARQPRWDWTEPGASGY